MHTLNDLIETRFEKEISSYQHLPEVRGEYSEFPPELHPDLRAVLNSQKITQLYSHQKEAFEKISKNKATLLVSNTASGKTLSFFLPVLNEYVNASSPFSVLLLYPTKALSRDQESTFGQLMEVVKKSHQLGTFDGDTPRDERTRIQRSADFVITNPDMLHSGILPNHNRKWNAFLSRLRYIIVDEVHIYRGAFGSHVSNVFRRLLRVCKIHESYPVFICSSATVGNPEELVEALFHNKFEVIKKDGAPKPEKNLYFINPPRIKSQGHAMYRKGTSSVSIPIIREAAKKKIRTICFCRSRQEVERLHRAVTDRYPELRRIIQPYRGGLLPNERRKLERDLAEKKIICIISTNALELGIDIGDLELCILSGHPGTVASFWQQAGRVGRKDKGATVVFIAKDRPVDQYMAHHPDYIRNAQVEQAWLNGDNPYILLQHLPCMAYEHPLRKNEENINPDIYTDALELLKKEKTVTPFRETYRYALKDYPARGVSLRGMTDYNIEIYCAGVVIGELDPIGARGTLYKDAIYQHLGRRYMSMDLDLEKKLCRVEPVEVDYYTEACWHGSIIMTEVDEQKNIRGALLEFGEIHYNKQPKLYKKIRERSYENIGYGPITLNAFEYDTTGLSLLPPRQWSELMESKDKRYLGAALYGLSYLMRQIAPSLCMAALQDVEADVSLIEEQLFEWKSALYLFDTIEGGVGFCEKIFDKLEVCLEICLQVLNECDCKFGCPACVPPLPPGVTNEKLESLLVVSNASVTCTKSLLVALLKGDLIQPEVEMFTLSPVPSREALLLDIERIKTQQRLSRASKILKRKRERLH